MKKLLTLIIFSLLLQSFTSYTRAVNFKGGAGGFTINENVKITKNNDTELKGKVLSADKDQIVITTSKTKQVVKTPLKDILGV